jgi:hypothetical protein
MTTLSIKLRNDGVITTPGAPFEGSDAQEVEDLIAKGVFSFELYDPTSHGGHRMFKSSMVREVKGKGTKPYEKSRLIIQGYQDGEIDGLLTQSPTIQRASPRLLFAVAHSLLKKVLTLFLRDLTQAYPQSKKEPNRVVLAQLPKELVPRYPKDTILRLINPLWLYQCGRREAGDRGKH